MRTLLAALLVAMAPGVVAHDAAHPGTQRKAFDASHAEDTPFGRAADPAKAAREVRIAMDDTMRFSPAHLTVKRGETVRFVLTNRGKQVHEMVLGTPAELERHAQMMREHPGMEHDEPHMLHVAPGKSGRMGWQFTKAGKFEYACLIAGHFEAGMVGTIVVTDK